MQNSKIGDWQHPFVDIFKRYDTFNRTQAFKGTVSELQDNTIARRCLKLTGATPSNSTVVIPADGNMELTGRYLYLQLQPLQGKYFVIRVQLGIKDREPGVKFVFTNMDKQYQVQGGNTLKIPAPIIQKGGWNIFCIDIQHHLSSFGLLPKSSTIAKGNYHIKKIQICANQIIRGIYTSDSVYDWNSIPKEMGFKAVKGQKWDEFYNFHYLPQDIKPETVRQNKRRQQEEEEDQIPVERELQVTQKPLPPLPKQKPTIQSFPQQTLLNLNYALAFSALHNPDLVIYQNKLCYSSGSLIVWKNLQTGEQQFLLGHTDYVAAMDSDDDWLVTAQRGTKAIIRVWIGMKCVSSFQSPFQKVQQVRLNRSKHLAMVGLDGSHRQTIMVFDLSEVELNKKPEFIAKQVSDFNIATLKWSPVQTDRLVSCGKQNIRFWRIKSQHLPGSPVILNHHARNTAFNVLDFQNCFDEPNPLTQLQKVKKVYVGSQQGLLFQVNYHTHQLEEVFKLHEGGICSLAVSSGFCVTGGEDQAIRVWPLDFSEYILEAQHQGTVTSLAIASDGASVACGTATGGLGILDLGTHNYRTVLRSHTDTLRQVVHHTFSNLLISLSDDLTIRLWDPEKMEQTYQFTYPKEDSCTCISGNPLGMYFAAGFQSGILRIFDIEKTGILEEFKNHNSAIRCLEYSPDGKYLIVVDASIAMLYSPMHGHQPIKHLPIDLPSKSSSASFSPDSQTLALIGDSSTHIDLWNTSSLQMIGKIFTGRSTNKVVFAPNGDLWAVFDDCSIRRYNIDKLTIQVEMAALHRGSVKGIAFDLDRHILYSVGEDSLLKLWDYSFQRQPHQAYIGHVGPINGVLCLNRDVWTIGSEGLFLWVLNKKLESFEPSYVKSRPANFIKAPPQKDKGLTIVQQSIREVGNAEEINQNKRQISNKHQPILFSQKLRQKAQEEAKDDIEITQEAVLMKFSPKQLTFKKSKRREHKNRQTLGLPEINIKHNLPFNHFYKQKLQSYQMQYSKKIFLLKENIPTFGIKYVLGQEVYGHDNVVWNWVMGWFAYTLDNLLIIDVLGKDRVQKIIPLPEKLGQLLVSKDFKKLFVSSAFNPSIVAEQRQVQDTASVSSQTSKADQAQFANIYIFNKNWEVERKLSFHSRGVQGMAISNDSRFLVSIGNFRQCTVCVWDMMTGKLRASNYTLDKLNDIKISEDNGRGLQFATVGRDQVNFWSFSTKQDTLEYHDVFIPKTKEGKLVEITTCEYIDPRKLIIGLTNGQVLIISTQTYKTISSKLVCNSCSEITIMRELKGDILVGTMAGDLNLLQFGSVINEAQITGITKIVFGSPVISVCLDPDDGEGLVGTSEGIYFANMKEKFQKVLIGNLASPVVYTSPVDDTLFLTAHQNSQIKLWHQQAGVLIKTYKWKNPSTASFYDPLIQKIYCFIQGGKQVKLINVKRFSKDQIYDTQGASDSIISVSEVSYGDLKAKWAFGSKGQVYAFELVEQKRKKTIKMVKVLELGIQVQSAIPISDKNLLFIEGADGIVSSYTVETLENQTKYGLNLIDRASFEDAKGESSQVKGKVHIAVNKGSGETYFSIVQNQPFVYLRNFMKRITLSKILLISLPKCINITTKKDRTNIIVGLQNGGISIIDAFQPQKRHDLTSIINSSINSVLPTKGNQIILVHNNACAIYGI